MDQMVGYSGFKLGIVAYGSDICPKCVLSTVKYVCMAFVSLVMSICLDFMVYITSLSLLLLSCFFVLASTHPFLF